MPSFDQGARPCPLFDSRDSRCKTPFGAVTLGTEITLTFRGEAKSHLTQVTLLLRHEFANKCEELPLKKHRNEDHRPVFSVRFAAPEQAELLWYHFRLEYQDGSTRLYDRYGYVEKREPAEYQQTVYKKNHTPAWFGEGVSYQIFPDRFRRTHIPSAQGMIGNRFVHTDWSEPVFFEPRTQEPQWCYDFYGGNLLGIREKLPYLKSLGVGTIYLCPIFEASSNHRYNTADYLRIDPLVGDEEDFRTLCEDARELDIRIMIDGVFNHSGHDSRYFNASGYYGELGAGQSKDSPYYSWYRFPHWPDQYESWWGMPTLPSVNELDPTYLDFIVTNENSVVRRWLRAGASAWRLDVADELPDAFIAAIRKAMEEENPDSFLMGEVWEDASNKIAYSERRRYFLGDELHGVMNYPFRTAALEYLRGGDAANFYHRMEDIRENYPPDAFYGAMNFLSTHDTPRMLTLLGVPDGGTPADKAERALYRLSVNARELAEQRLRLGALLLFCFPGSPLIYYGDEAGMEGMEDPFNRGTYPWGAEDSDLVRFHQILGQLRSKRESLRKGDLRYLYASGSVLAFSRSYGEETTLLILNAADEALTVTIPCGKPLLTDALDQQRFFAPDGQLTVTLPPLSGLLLI